MIPRGLIVKKGDVSESIKSELINIVSFQQADKSLSKPSQSLKLDALVKNLTPPSTPLENGDIPY